MLAWFSEGSHPTVVAWFSEGSHPGASASQPEAASISRPLLQANAPRALNMQPIQVHTQHAWQKTCARAQKNIVAGIFTKMTMPCVGSPAM